jgi:pimeloyl-ACP methyl ester carboxylesterase
VNDWRAQGTRHRVFGRDVFAVSVGPTAGPTAGPTHGPPGAPSDTEPILVLHGFPSSSRDFSAALPRLASLRRVVVHDHLGFGLSEKPADYSYSLLEQAEVALGLWRSLGIARGHLVAHDYGTSVATELLARRERGLCPVDFASVTFCNGSVHLDLAHLTPAQRLLRRPRLGPIFARLASRRVFVAQLRRILGDPASVPESELDAMWEGLTRVQGRERLAALAGYMDERVRFRARWIDPLTRLDLRCHILWGRRDPVALPAIAEQLAREIPGATLTWLDDLGHYPMLEAPARWADAVLAFLGPRTAPD